VRAVRNTERGIEVVEAPEPEGAVRVRVRASGICGSDLHMLRWGPSPVTLGHEISGVLDDGTPVAIWPLDPCGTCDRCVAGELQQCRVVLGTILLQVLQNLVNLLGIPSSLNFAVMGTVILIGVLADQYLVQRRRRAVTANL